MIVPQEIRNAAENLVTIALKSDASHGEISRAAVDMYLVTVHTQFEQQKEEFKKPHRYIDVWRFLEKQYLALTHAEDMPLIQIPVIKKLNTVTNRCAYLVGQMMLGSIFSAMYEHDGKASAEAIMLLDAVWTNMQKMNQLANQPSNEPCPFCHEMHDNE